MWLKSFHTRFPIGKSTQSESESESGEACLYLANGRTEWKARQANEQNEITWNEIYAIKDVFVCLNRFCMSYENWVVGKIVEFADATDADADVDVAVVIVIIVVVVLNID